MRLLTASRDPETKNLRAKIAGFRSAKFAHASWVESLAKASPGRHWFEGVSGLVHGLRKAEPRLSCGMSCQYLPPRKEQSSGKNSKPMSSVNWISGATNPSPGKATGKPPIQL